MEEKKKLGNYQQNKKASQKEDYGREYPERKQG